MGKYPSLIAKALKNAFVLGSTYVCKALIGKMVRIKNQYHNRLTDDQLKQLLRTASYPIALHFDKLIKSQSQYHGCIELVFIFCQSFVVVVILQYMLELCFVAILSCIVCMKLLTT